MNLSIKIQNYVKLYPFLQFVGLELVAAGLIYQRFHSTLGFIVAVLGAAASAYAFGYIARKDGLKSLLNIRRLLQTGGYAAILAGLVLAGGGEKEALIAFVGTGVAMAGFVYDMIYP